MTRKRVLHSRGMAMSLMYKVFRTAGVLIVAALIAVAASAGSRAFAGQQCYDQVLMWEDVNMNSDPDANEWKGHATSPTNDPPDMDPPMEAPPQLSKKVSHPNWIPTWYGQTSWDGEVYHPTCPSSTEPEEEEGGS
jgi:hypothetical protein